MYKYFTEKIMTDPTLEIKQTSGYKPFATVRHRCWRIGNHVQSLHLAIFAVLMAQTLLACILENHPGSILDSWWSGCLQLTRATLTLSSNTSSRGPPPVLSPLSWCENKRFVFNGLSIAEIAQGFWRKMIRASIPPPSDPPRLLSEAPSTRTWKRATGNLFPECLHWRGPRGVDGILEWFQIVYRAQGTGVVLKFMA